jgi:hypothetical protein
LIAVRKYTPLSPFTLGAAGEGEEEEWTDSKSPMEPLWLGFMIGISLLSRLLVSALIVVAVALFLLETTSRCKRRAESLCPLLFCVRCWLVCVPECL